MDLEKKRSTVSQLIITVHDFANSLHLKQQTDAILLDFSKAFDKVETGVLLHKLRDAKVLGKTGKWLAAFLDSGHRQQAVAVEGALSGLSPVISGVP